MAAQKILLGSVSNNRSRGSREKIARRHLRRNFNSRDEFLRNSYDYADAKTDDDDTISLKGERARSKRNVNIYTTVKVSKAKRPLIKLALKNLHLAVGTETENTLARQQIIKPQMERKIIEK
jgi:hypothetical protein